MFYGHAMKAMKTQHAVLAQRLALFFLVTTYLVLVAVGCNTAHGFGKDVERAGEKIQDGTK